MISNVFFRASHSVQRSFENEGHAPVACPEERYVPTQHFTVCLPCDKAFFACALSHAGQSFDVLYDWNLKHQEGYRKCRTERLHDQMHALVRSQKLYVCMCGRESLSTDSGHYMYPEGCGGCACIGWEEAIPLPSRPTACSMPGENHQGSSTVIIVEMITEAAS